MATSIVAMEDNIKALIQSVTSNITVYDPDDMLELTAHIAPPFVGLVYLGLDPNGLDKEGRSAKMMFGIYILGTKKNLTSKKNCPTTQEGVSEADLVSITQFLQDLREAIGGQTAPSMHKWQLRTERPYTFDDKGIGYHQVWQATVQSI
ncbi:hypothetical protein ACRXCV_00420 (plasmid) [Halobacteriovorax sp. GFR7]|uniref:hypothetical protein n=1 Tax=unclassified Halobacteriovorax TaxID=2639665 RepID=UPI003D961B4C